MLKHRLVFLVIDKIETMDRSPLIQEQKIETKPLDLLIGKKIETMDRSPIIQEKTIVETTVRFPNR